MLKVNKKVNSTNRRRLVSEKECRFDLKQELPLMFEAFKRAHERFEKEIKQTPPPARARAFEASLLNSKMIQSIQEIFPNNWKFGKYKRFTLRISGYTVLFKKLNNNGKPMNINTKTVNAITQQLSFSLFDNSSSVFEPIIFFGYQKDKLGEIKNPRLIYIDEDQLKWEITESSVQTKKTITLPLSTELDSVQPRIKKGSQKKASGE